MSNRKLWTKKDGKKIRIKDMSNSHLINTIRLLLRYAENERNEALCCYPSFDPDSMAAYYSEQQWDSLDEMDAWEFAEMEYPVFKDLREEAEKRKLKISYLGE